VPSNPFASLPVPASVTEREHVLTDDEIGRVWRAAAGLPTRGQEKSRVAKMGFLRHSEIYRDE
jgi:hypothetical protein